MKIFTETARFILREIVPGDVDGLFELDSDPEVHRYLGNRPVQSKEQIREVIRFIRQQYIDNGIGRWAIIAKSDGQFVGWTGLKLVREPINQYVDFHDLGYRLIRRYWGQGIATECAIASLDYGFDIMRLQEIYAAAHMENSGSNRVLVKLGMRCLETFDYDGAPHNWYKIARQEWANGG